MPHTHSPEEKAEHRVRSLCMRAQYLRDVAIPRAQTCNQRDARAGELAAIRWVLRIVDEDWDLALDLVPRPEDADLDPEEDQ
jgi:hypothetical protein